MRKSHIYLFAIAIVLVSAAALIQLSGNSTSGDLNLTRFDGQQVPANVINMLHVPANISAAIGIGSARASSLLGIGSNASLTSDGKPLIIYVGAEYCPYCAFERWAMIVALLRFGNFTGLHYMTSSSSDVFANTPTFSFYNSSYTSNYISFQSVEETTNKPNGPGSYVPLQAPDALQASVFSAFDLHNLQIPSSSRGGIPFIDFANQSALVGVTYDDPGILDPLNWSQIAASLYNTSSLQAQAIVGSANMFTAQICKITGNEPASVCSANYVKIIENEIK